MRLRFLCEEHRQRLEADPESAGALWFRCADQRHCNDQRPTPHDVSLAGSALEASHIFLASMTLYPRALIDRYAHTALHLIELMSRLGQSQLGIVVVAVATARLEQLMRRGAHKEACQRACLELVAAGRTLLHEEHGDSRHEGTLAYPLKPGAIVH